MNTIDIEELISDIENALADNGMVLEVLSVEPDEVKDDVAFLDIFRMLHPNSSLLNEENTWIKLAYGESFAYVGVRQEEDKLEALVDVGEECPIEDLGQMIADGISCYADRAGVEDVRIRRGDKNN